MDAGMTEKRLSVRRVAEYLGVSRRTIYRWIGQGIIKARKSGGGGLLPQWEILEGDVILAKAWLAEIRILAERGKVSTQRVRRALSKDGVKERLEILMNGQE
jgi:excisionase family DNA binding protein